MVSRDRANINDASWVVVLFEVVAEYLAGTQHPVEVDIEDLH